MAELETSSPTAQLRQGLMVQARTQTEPLIRGQGTQVKLVGAVSALRVLAAAPLPGKVCPHTSQRSVLRRGLL